MIIISKRHAGSAHSNIRPLAILTLLALHGGAAIAQLARSPMPTPAGMAAHPSRQSLVTTREGFRAKLRSLPLSFEPNRGQARHDVEYLVRNCGYTLSLERGAAVITLPTRF